MITKNQIKLIRSLQQKKFRIEHQLFVVEGQKPIDELLKSSLKVINLYVRKGMEHHYPLVEEVSASDMERISSMKSAPGFLALVEMPSRKEIKQEKNTLVLDGIADPGNLGTIIRTADWFGFKQIIVSVETVDEFNPKTIQSAMGSLFRVQIKRMDLPNWLAGQSVKKFGFDMKGESVYDGAPKEGIYILGKESTGLSNEVRAQLDGFLSIPGNGDVESLNASIACGILLSEIHKASLS